MSPIDRIPSDVLATQVRYVAGASSVWSRAWRSAVAAWRCSRIAARHRARVRAWRALRAADRALRRARRAAR
jgi:hypothetical protein